MPTKPPPLVCKVSAKFYGYRVPRGQLDGSLQPYSRLSRLRQLLFFFLKELLNCTDEAERTALKTHYFSENVVVPEIESGPLDLKPITLTTRPQKRDLLSST
jgi:hypothetical protein